MSLEFRHRVEEGVSKGPPSTLIISVIFVGGSDSDISPFSVISDTVEIQKSSYGSLPDSYDTAGGATSCSSLSASNAVCAPLSVRFVQASIRALLLLAFVSSVCDYRIVAGSATSFRSFNQRSPHDVSNDAMWLVSLDVKFMRLIAPLHCSAWSTHLDDVAADTVGVTSPADCKQHAP